MLHPPHLDNFIPHVHDAGDIAAKQLSKDFQAHARSKGLPDELVDNLHVRYDPVTSELRPGVKDPAYHSALQEWEHGNLEHGPTAVVKTFNSSHESHAKNYFENALMQQMAGRVS